MKNFKKLETVINARLGKPFSLFVVSFYQEKTLTLCFDEHEKITVVAPTFEEASRDLLEIVFSLNMDGDLS